MHLFRRLTVAAAVAAVTLPLLTASAASANTAPELACGSTQPGQCTETAHYTDQDEWLTPPDGGVPAECPSFIATDVTHVTGSGNGVEHVTVNKAQDAWFTSTFTGNVTLTQYPLSSVVLDNERNVVAVVGPPESSQPVFTGKQTEWFGGSFNNKNSINHGTLTLDVTGGGQALHVHDTFHASWAPGADPNGPPTKAFDKLTCS
jgi:hypothetical protein